PILCNMLEIPSTEKMEINCQKIISDFNLKILILTCGSHGSYVFTPNIISSLPTPKVNVKDTVGAGDAFTAAFTAAPYKSRDIKKSHEFAVTYSAHICTHNGAMPFVSTEWQNEL
ncbi:MAG: PfkB family carbohydrate kinase, partial [Odoribacter sp.]|nr:PfkB family carbohydrate kinase [Odoribacter sp.]